MPQSVPVWWTDDRVEDTVNQGYIYSHLRPDEQELLKQSPSFGDGLTDDTYLDWILTRAKRFFLILVDTGVPDQIFGIIDDSYDDGDLPVPEEAVPDLRLSRYPNQSLDRRFFKTQFRYLIRVVGDGEHIRYAPEETLPVYPVSLKSVVISLGKDGVDKVRLPSEPARVFTRKRIGLDGNLTETAALSEIASVKKFAHEHLVSIYGSYLHDESLYLLLTPAPEHSLKSFLSDVPKMFENLPKQDRRKILINWPHCLANGLAWLHAHGRHHGTIRPSNIIVDEQLHISFGQFDDTGILGGSSKVDDIEAYQYAAPERWKRAVTMQSTGPNKVSLHSGGRTARKAQAHKILGQDSTANGSRHLSWTSEMPRLDTSRPTSTSYSFMPTSKGNFSRLQLGKVTGESLVTPAFPNTLESSHADFRLPSSYPPTKKFHSRPSRSDTPSVLSTTSSGSNATVKPIFVAAPEIRTVVVQTWHSALSDLFSADVFALGAVTLDILTLLCKRSASSFAKHRSAKNRTPGRGGGLADASFHANLGQVIVWASILQEDAKKKSKKDEGSVFRAVGPVIQVAKRCLEREPEERVTSQELERMLEDYIVKFAEIDQLHCRRELSKDHAVQSPVQERFDSMPLPDKKRSLNTVTDMAADTAADTNMDEDVSHAAILDGEWPMPPKSPTLPSPGPESSMSSLSSFAFDYDMKSDTLVGDDVNEDRARFSSGHESQKVDLDPKHLDTRLESKAPRVQRWNNWHNNDSAVDPSLSPTVDKREGSRHLGYSESEDDDVGHGQSFLLPESRPTSMIPYGPLPTIVSNPSNDDKPTLEPGIAAPFSQAVDDHASSLRGAPSPPTPAYESKGGLQPVRPSGGEDQEEEVPTVRLAGLKLATGRRKAHGKGKSYMKDL